MDIEELQATWAQMSEELEKQKKLTNEIILKMTHQNYKDKLNKIAIPEKISAVFTYVVAAILLFRFYELNTLPLQICGVITLAILIVLPYFSLKYLRDMRNLNISVLSYKESIIRHEKSKLRYQRFMKFTVYAGFVLMLVIIPVVSKIFNGDDIFSEPQGNFWYWFLPVGMVFYYLFTRKIVGCYNGNIKKAGVILKELE
ncbi:MAG: hypothetical protein KJO52_02665 [Maribacter sp.]|nr:hypothetical protein [Maribacter sp.]MBT8300269.1 hypothetical protein [Maribacter sp.]